MVDRIRQLMGSRELSPSQFADKIEVPRATVSHILSGRNKPSLEVVQRILQAFPDLDPGWFVLGLAATPTGLAMPTDDPPKLDRPPPISPDRAEDTMLGEEQHENVHFSEPTEFARAIASKRQKKVERIIFFYTDHSFTEYFPES